MKVVMVIPSFPRYSETFIVSKFLGLLGAGWDVHVVCSKTDPSEWGKFPALKGKGQEQLTRRVHRTMPVDPHWLVALLFPFVLLHCLLAEPVGTIRYFRRGLRLFHLDVLRTFYLDAEMVMLQPDLVHFEFGALAVGRTYLKELLGCKIAVSFRGYDLNFAGLENPAYYDEVWKGADVVHLLSEDLWRRAQRRGCPSDKAHVLIPPAIDPEFFDPGLRKHDEVVGTPDRALRLLSVGRLEWKKGYEYGLQAVRLLLESGVHCEYHIMGGGAYLEAIAFARHQLGLEHTVHLLGAGARDEVRTQMLWADVLLHPAASEGFSNAVLEAQAMMLPVVCSDADGLSENVCDGLTGYVTPRRNPETMAQRLAVLSGKPEQRQQMGEVGRLRVMREFRVRDQVRAFGEMYTRLLCSDPGSENLCPQSPTLVDSQVRAT